MTAGSQSYELKDWLRDLSWEHIISLQYDIADELARRVRDMQNNQRRMPSNTSDTEDITWSEISEKHRSPSGKFFVSARNQHIPSDADLNSQPLIPGTLELNGKQFLLTSSPLKKDTFGENSKASNYMQSSPAMNSPNVKIESPQKPLFKSYTKIPQLKQESLRPKVVSDVEGDEEQISDSEGDLTGPIIKDPPSSLRRPKRIKVDFNINPITKRPWIYEDFSPNHEVINTLSKSRLKDYRRTKMNEMAGIEQEETKTLANHDASFNESFPLYENLRHRSKSPPGYGRMDFPTTQELREEKELAQEMIYQRTKHRFKMAVQTGIPRSEREYYFKNAQLNEWVDNGEITWSKDKLQVYRKTPIR
ncbi:HHL154Wp [Eremothecium sinecaudum]|uniref:HHL154Wp n=1 Tax=Eremothecium sinecaudum TaxID=45286 RepID=A0A0X8HVR1_9SACH|nr:HHL154Wp [Eremothecium sinecaudum]AMD22616.1 HHL154Wp [Eremothecium sinecaudum]